MATYTTPTTRAKTVQYELATKKATFIAVPENVSHIVDSYLSSNIVERGRFPEYKDKKTLNAVLAYVARLLTDEQAKDLVTLGVARQIVSRDGVLTGILGRIVATEEALLKAIDLPDMRNTSYKYYQEHIRGRKRVR